MDIEEIKRAHEEGMEEMAKDIIAVSKVLGDDHSLVQKMKTVYETMSSFTEAEVTLFAKLVMSQE